MLNEEGMKPKGTDALCLYARKDSVAAINRGRLAELEGRTVTYGTVISYEEGFRKEDLDELICRQIPPDLSLKEGARVIFTATDYRGAHRSGKDPGGPAYVNGLTGTVSYAPSPGPSSIPRPVNVLTAWGKKVTVEPVTVPLYGYFAEGGHLVRKKVASFKQLPLELAYAITIHRSQGQTFYAVRVCPEVFVPGQLYVALSRVVGFEGLSLTRPVAPSDIMVSSAVREFYSKGGRAPKKKAGRPLKNEACGPLDRMIWVPAPLVGYVMGCVKEVIFIGMASCPAYAPGQKHVRVPSALYPALSDEIRKWKDGHKGSQEDAGAL